VIAFIEHIAKISFYKTLSFNLIACPNPNETTVFQMQTNVNLATPRQSA
jgi:hypothetical protein